MKWQKMDIRNNNAPPLFTEVLLRFKRQYPDKVVMGIRTEQKPDNMVISCYQHEKMDSVFNLSYFSHWAIIDIPKREG